MFTRQSRRGLRDITNSTNVPSDTNAAVKPSVREPTRPSSERPSSSYQHSGTVDNIDARDANDPLCATEYVREMYSHFRSVEASTSTRPTYMKNQPHINEKMRSILVDWLVEVHLKFKLVPETLYLCVNLIDRYLTTEKVSRPKLQLVGVTCLLIASKYEEIYPPELRDLVYICDRAYSKSEILDMEETILKALDYSITIPSAHAFLVRYLKAAHADKKMVQLSCYILDGTLQSYKLLNYLPSEMAAAAVYIARRAAGRNCWSPTLLKYAEYAEEDIIGVARDVMREKNEAQSDLRAVNKKYSSSRYGGVANTVLSSDF
mmetsp:Transcript_6059/g.12106  ORF Transcript_6059/g.12106 Transcript_6059/m.12106 type:complete len:319 (+) Transcript_6059:27-983(+)